jgi:hypothetical protein
VTSGGNRNRGGARPDPNSARSEARGYSLQALPAEGYTGPVPNFPLPRATIRELELWEWVWRTPQACAWSMPSERWRLHAIGMWVRTAVICEGSDATAADKNSIHRFADQIGMTTAGLAEMGWKVAVDELAEKAATPSTEPAAPRARRLRSADA